MNRWKNTPRALACVSSTLALMATAQGAWAGDDEQQQGSPIDDRTIIVTANRQAQNIQKVSAAVQVVDGAALRSQALVNVAQIFADSPSIQATTQPGGFSINVRGQGADLPSGSAQGAVALEFDGVYNILSLGTLVGFFDVNHVEVLPGPQSTRYGPNADGGIVNVISNEARLNDWSGSAAMTLGTYNLYRGEFAQNVPITGTLAMRVSGAFIDRVSYYTPAAANAMAQSGRVKLLWQPSGDVSVKLGYQRDHLGGTGTGVEPRGISKVAPYAGDSINAYANPWAQGDTSTTNPLTANHANVTQQTVTGSLGYQFAPWAAVDLSGAYVNVKGVERTCYAGGAPWTVGGDHQCYDAHDYAPFNQYTGEVRLHNNAGSKVLWNLGYYHWQYKKLTWSNAQAAYASPAYAGGGSTQTDAVYGDVIYPLTDRLRAIGGARESHDKRGLVPGNAVTTWFYRTIDHFDFRAGEEFDITPSSMQYFTISSGYRPGGLTYSGAAGTALPFANEVNTAFEIGLKNKFFGNRLTLNLSAFYYKQSNYQVIDSYAGFNVTVNGAPYTCTNGPNQPTACSVPSFNVQAHELGLEVQARFNPTSDDSIGVSASFLDARFNRKQGACAATGLTAAYSSMTCPYGYNDMTTNALAFYELAGAVQPHSPKAAITASYDHTFHVKGGASLHLGGDLYHSSGYWLNPVQDAAMYGWQPTYTTGNVQAGFRPAGDRWSINAYIRNVSNYAVKQSVLPITTLGDPRTYGVTLGVKW